MAYNIKNQPDHTYTLNDTNAPEFVYALEPNEVYSVTWIVRAPNGHDVFKIHALGETRMIHGSTGPVTITGWGQASETRATLTDFSHSPMYGTYTISVSVESHGPGNPGGPSADIRSINTTPN